ncbi:VWA containing CoxE family protein, partial [Streptomyces sp. NPDC001274]
MTEHTTAPAAGTTPSGADPQENRRQVLYWRLLARLFDQEEQAALESAGLAVVAPGPPTHRNT